MRRRRLRGAKGDRASMAELILQHCVPVIVVPVRPDPTDVELSFTIGGSSGDGQVDVTAGPGEIPATICLPSGSSGTINIPQVTQLTVHYRRSKTGPSSIPVTVNSVTSP